VEKSLAWLEVVLGVAFLLFFLFLFTISFTFACSAGRSSAPFSHRVTLSLSRCPAGCGPRLRLPSAIVIITSWVSISLWSAPWSSTSCAEVHVCVGVLGVDGVSSSVDHLLGSVM
jgi:hypothetical protein